MPGTVPDELRIVVVVLLIFIAYVFAKVRKYMRQSDEAWRQVDKSKLKKWTDDED